MFTRWIMRAVQSLHGITHIPLVVEEKRKKRRKKRGKLPRTPIVNTHRHAEDDGILHPVESEVINQEYLDRICCEWNHHGYVIYDGFLTIICGCNELDCYRVCLATGAVSHTTAPSYKPAIRPEDLVVLQGYQARWSMYPALIVDRCNENQCWTGCNRARKHPENPNRILVTAKVVTLFKSGFKPGETLHLVDPGLCRLGHASIFGSACWEIIIPARPR
jgi:hypothetical protein